MSLPPIIIVGAGGHAKVALDALRRAGRPVLGMVDQDQSKHGKIILGATVLGGDDVVFARRPEEIVLVNGVGSVRRPRTRRDVYERFTARGFKFTTVIHPSAIIAENVVLGAGAQIMAGAVIQAGARIGADTIINTGATLDHDCDIGEHVHVAPGVTLSGDVVVGPTTHIGCGATIVQGVKIGPDCLVHAGAVVVADIAEGAVAALTTTKNAP
jgi:UDP-perosamine 4-acetyltransferase